MKSKKGIGWSVLLDIILVLVGLAVLALIISGIFGKTFEIIPLFTF